MKQKYGSPEDIAQRILEWLGQNARQDATSLLLYEAMQALKDFQYVNVSQGSLTDREREWVRHFLDCRGLGAKVVEGPEYEAVCKFLLAKMSATTPEADEKNRGAHDNN